MVTALMTNVMEGARLALGMRVRLSEFRPGLSQVVALILFTWLLDIGIGYVSAPPPRYFNVYGITHGATTWLAFLFSAYLLARLQGRTTGFASFLLLVAAALPVLHVIGAPVGFWLVRNELTGGVQQLAWTFWVLFMVWMTAIAYRVVRIIYVTRAARAVTLVAVYAACNVALTFAVPSQRVWYTDYSGEDSEQGNVVVIQQTKEFAVSKIAA